MTAAEAESIKVAFAAKAKADDAAKELLPILTAALPINTPIPITGTPYIALKDANGNTTINRDPRPTKLEDLIK